MMSFPQLPLLEAIASRQSTVIQRRLTQTLLVGVQHLLETTGSLMETLLRLGLRSENTLLLGKAYSSNADVVAELRGRGLLVDKGSLPTKPGGFEEVFRRDVDRLWNRALEKLRSGGYTNLVVLDDGGRCLAKVPQEVHQLARVAGVEQTTGGLAWGGDSSELRVVEVATSGAKRVLESPMISRAVLGRLPAVDESIHWGVVGLGNVGGAIASHLLKSGRTVRCFDHDPRIMETYPAAIRADSFTQVIQDSEIVLGCTGDDLFAEGAAVEWRDGETILVSCSSEDREYRSLLTAAAASGLLEEWTPLGPGRVRFADTRLRLLRGGFPLNFDGSRESVPAREIQLTRALLLGGLLQALLCGEGKNSQGESGRMLDPMFQSWTVRAWLQTKPPHLEPLSLDVMRDAGSEDLLEERSGGVREDTEDMRAALKLP